VQKSNSHYAPQPYTNQSVFKSLLNCTSEISLSRNATGRVPETRSSDEKTPVSELRSCSCLWHTSRHQPIAVIGGRCRSRADNLQPRTVEAGRVYALCTRTASLKSMSRCQLPAHGVCAPEWRAMPLLNDWPTCGHTRS